MSFITDIKWKGLQTFDEIETWFCLPMQEYLKMFDEQFVEPETVLFDDYKISPAENRACFFYYEMRSKLDDLSKLLDRLMDEYRENPIPDKSELEPLSDESKKMLAEKLAAIREKSKKSTNTAEQAA